MPVLSRTGVWEPEVAGKAAVWATSLKTARMILLVKLLLLPVERVVVKRTGICGT
jgi:hypothetical protein